MNAPARDQFFTVTVGIPAHNEEANIANIIDSVLNQRRTNFILKKIIVINDGSTDSTGAIVHRIALKNPLVRLINHIIRKGKAARLNELYANNDSDIFIQFDADILLGDDCVISRMVEHFRQSDVILVAGHCQPLPGRSFFEKVTNASDLMWHEVKQDYNNGDSIYNSSGCISALERSFASAFRFPFGTVADQQELYLAAKNMHGQFRYAADAVVHYRSPNNLKDFVRQASRSLTEKLHVKGNYDCDRASFYYIPIMQKIRGVISAMAKNPFYTACAIVLQLYLRIRVRRAASFNDEGLWQMVSSTKNLKH